MHIRRLFAIGALILIGGILAACGSEDEDTQPTPAPATRITSDQEAEIEPTATEAATEESAASTPMASPAATPVTVATPDVEIVTVTDESSDATPEADAVVPIIAAEEDAGASPASTEVSMVELSGTLTLDGRIQQDYTLTEEGCVGLGEWRQLEPGTQVIVRNASGTVVDVAALEKSVTEDDCAWSFAVSVPAADYFSISIPMVTEVWFDQNDPAVQSGELELFVP